MTLFTQNLTYDLLGILFTIIICMLAYLKWTYGYWKRKGLFQIEPSIPFGNGTKMFLGQESFYDMYTNIYKEIKSKGQRHGGAYLLTQKIYVPVDLDLIKHIMQIDFQHFMDHGFYHNEEADPLTGNLFIMKGERWRSLRTKMTPTFTASKMKMIFQTIANCAEGLEEILLGCQETITPFDVKDIMARYTIDIICSTGFGLETSSLKNPESEFRKYGQKIFKRDFIGGIKNYSQFAFPEKLLKLIKFKMFPKDIYDFFFKIVSETVEYRENNNVHRKDFMHLLLQLKNLGTVSDSDQFMENGEKRELGLTMNQLLAQVFVFFAAGYETSSSTMTFALYELTKNPKIQRKVQAEIDTVLSKYDNKISYEGMMEMTYMLKVIQETLRMYPPLPVLPRECSQTYKVPNTDIIIEKGTMVMIPIFGIQRDPEYFPNPDVFNPENFNEENIATRHQYTWLPFGEGPRICIGMRLGLLETKVGLTTILKNYNVALNKNTPPFKFSKNDLTLGPEGKILIDLEKR